MSSIFYRFLPAIIWMVIIFWLSHQSGQELNTYLPWVQQWMPWIENFNFGHFIAYFILAGLLWWAIGSYRLSISFIVVLLCLLYGITDEFHQSFVEGRTADLKDIINDTIGATLAMMFVRLPFIKNRLFSRRIP